MRHNYLLAVIIGLVLPLTAFAQRQVFHISRPFLDNLTEQFGGDKMDSGEMDENDDAVLAYMRRVKEKKAVTVDGFTTFRGTIRTKSIHLHWDEGDVMEEAYDMNVSGRWNYDVEWPSDDIDPHLILRRWINSTIRAQLEDTFYGDCPVVPYPGGSKEF